MILMTVFLIMHLLEIVCFCSDLFWEDTKQNELIEFMDDSETAKLEKNMKIGNDFDDPTRNDIIQIIQKYWDCFWKEGASRKKIGYGFGIDTGDSKPVCCKKPAYVPHESKIIMDRFQQLFANRCSKLCKLPWGSLIVISAKPHQEHVTEINDFIWRMCVSYWKLNGVTKRFPYPIPQWVNVVPVLNVGAHCIWIITLDACQGYHQVAVQPIYQEQLALFAPANHKYRFSVMNFGPTNAPTFYSATRRNFKDDWDKWFIIWGRALSYINGEPVRVTD